MPPRSRDGFSPELSNFVRVLSSEEGAGKTGCAPHPRSRVRMHLKETCTRAYRFGGNTPAFPAQWFYVLYVLSLATWICLSPSPREALASSGLDANPGASGPHAFAVRKGSIRRAFAPETLASTAACPNVRDVRETPLLRGRMGALSR